MLLGRIMHSVIKLYQPNRKRLFEPNLFFSLKILFLFNWRKKLYLLTDVNVNLIILVSLESQ